ncbi:helix-turn-helix transcriptional regulator [Agromyces sp. NPDC049794]|uniref:PadR family transcriptional regulator n=1 Tax=unclassified Agromyces TaxID=2639701 RepID=UPI0033D589A9
MAVRDALLALLTAGPAYGFQLHGGLADRTGGRRAINVGQTYATLERLTKQGLVEPAGSTDDGLPLHRLTAAGRAAAAAWLEGADAAGADSWDETVDRVLIAQSLPDWNAAAVVAAERARWVTRRDEASVAAGMPPPPTERNGPGVDADVGEAALGRLAAAADVARAEAALSWLDSVGRAERRPFAPRSERPRRGRRPGSATAVGADVDTGDAAQASARA